MTNKPMLSVEREVIEKALRDALTIRFDTDSHVTKLRSLLDQPACTTPSGKTCPGDGVGACKKCPTAQHQGEPVAKAKPVAMLHAERLTGRDGEYGVTVEDSEWFNTCRLTGGIFNLYSEQPAPVVTVAKLTQAVHDVAGFPGVTGYQLRELADRLNGGKP